MLFGSYEVDLKTNERREGMAAKTDKIWMNGEFVDWDQANVHILTHTLHYGLGAFEGIRCYKCDDGRTAVFRLPEHIDRLFDSAHVGLMKIPFARGEIVEACLEALRINKLEEGYIRPLVFIGAGDERGLYVEKNPISVAIIVWPWGAYLGEEGLRKGIHAKTSSFTRHHPNAMMTKAKLCGNYINSILAKKEAKSAGYEEAIMLDPEGYVSEASGENIFIIRKGIVKTPPPTTILPGITRDTVFQLIHDEGGSVTEERFTRDELYMADEAFFTGTAAEITPIRRVDERDIGTGLAGEFALSIQSKYFDVVRGRADAYTHWLSYV